jgi:hypothetical protein
MGILNLIPDQVYKYIGIAVVGFLLFRKKIPILNKIDIQIKLPDEFMRHFRWITPLALICEILILLFLIFQVMDLKIMVQDLKLLVAPMPQKVGP